MLQRPSLFVASFLCLVAAASANPIIYHVTVGTSSISGTAGSLDFNFDPGPFVTQSASLQLLDFTSDGTLAGACPCGTGDISDQLPATVTFDNGTSFNDYFDDFTFGTTLSFDVSLYGPALSTPDGVSTSDSTFAFSMFSDAAGTIPALTTDTTDGFAFTILVNLDGSTTVTNYSPQTGVSPQTNAVPEPSGLILVGMGMTVILGVSRLRRGGGGKPLNRSTARLANKHYSNQPSEFATKTDECSSPPVLSR
jgi:hypothetical protein